MLPLPSGVADRFRKEAPWAGLFITEQRSLVGGEQGSARPRSRCPPIGDGVVVQLSEEPAILIHAPGGLALGRRARDHGVQQLADQAERGAMAESG